MPKYFGIKIAHPWAFFIAFPLLDLIFVDLFGLSSSRTSPQFLFGIAVLWAIAVFLPEWRYYPKEDEK